MFVSVIFPLADFRALHTNCAGRLRKPRWGEVDPQAKFARGFGPISTRTKSANGFAGENYYADCDNFIRYPQQLFFSPVVESERKILLYPIYRRFFFDGKTCGRFELGFRLNEATIFDIIREAKFSFQCYNAVNLARDILASEIKIKLLDGRELTGEMRSASPAICDAYIWSSTTSSLHNTYVASKISHQYVSVGEPYVFIRAGNQTPVAPAPDFRPLFSGEYLMHGAITGTFGRVIDTIIINSKRSMDDESAHERFSRLFYTQIRAILFAHSFYLRQIDDGKFSGQSEMQSSVSAMLDRIKNLIPLDGNSRDAEICAAMSSIVESSDIEPARLTAELKASFKPGLMSRTLRRLLPYFDKKVDLAVEAAASTVTKHVLTGGF